ncbi:thioesterase family protein [Paraburkholderia sp. BCC1886]|uniref:thioesterase family protein n=1 Tax=Paraburkholderia sp. BCC1886 TaxID=2562670 RepID=UPI001183698C|nr:hotdog domain-containing protein [Paraburkholderia sp. BCC1886]
MLKPGITETLAMRVLDTHLASTFAEADGEGYPDLLSTPAMLGLMERACAKAMRSALVAGHLSVGVKTEIAHLQPTSPGVTVEARATLQSIEGALYWFDVVASDPAGSIGTARHARAIVNREQIEQRAAQRRAV